MNIALKGDRVANDVSIIAHANGSFYDFNGSQFYRDISQLLEAKPHLAVNGEYTPPKVDQESCKEKGEGLIDEVKSWSFTIGELDRKLIQYIPFAKGNLQTLRNATALARNGELAVKFRDKDKREIEAVHYRTKIADRYEWRVLKGSDAFAYEALPAGEDGFVYAVFGAGDFLTAKILGLRYLAFGSDIAISKNSSKIESFKSTINAGGKRPTKIRLIFDNDDSGRRTIESFAEKGFDVYPFTWSAAFPNLDTKKWDLRDIGNHFEKLGFSAEDVYEFVTDSRFYRERF